MSIFSLVKSPHSARRQPVLSGASTEIAANGSILVMHGEWDIANQATLSEILSTIIDSADIDVLVDLSDVAFLDSSILVVFERTRSLLHQHGRRLTLRSPSASAALILGFFGLTDCVETGNQ
jgi:anti-anti-sigma factor